MECLPAEGPKGFLRGPSSHVVTPGWFWLSSDERLKRHLAAIPPEDTSSSLLPAGGGALSASCLLPFPRLPETTCIGPPLVLHESSASLAEASLCWLVAPCCIRRDRLPVTSVSGSMRWDAIMEALGAPSALPVDPSLSFSSFKGTASKSLQKPLAVGLPAEEESLAVAAVAVAVVAAEVGRAAATGVPPFLS